MPKARNRSPLSSSASGSRTACSLRYSSRSSRLAHRPEATPSQRAGLSPEASASTCSRARRQAAARAGRLLSRYDSHHGDRNTSTSGRCAPAIAERDGCAVERRRPRAPAAVCRRANAVAAAAAAPAAAGTADAWPARRERALELAVDEVPDVGDSPVAPDHDVLRRHPQVRARPRAGRRRRRSASAGRAARGSRARPRRSLKPALTAITPGRARRSRRYARNAASARGTGRTRSPRT